MIKPISGITNVTKQSKTSPKSLINKTEAKERLISLIKEFEEIFKSRPNNEALAKHIQNLKESLKMYQ